MGTSPDLKMYRSDTIVEVGTISVPINFGLCSAGQITDLPYDILLYNDKGDIVDSDEAKAIAVELLRLYATQNEVSNGAVSQQFTMSFIPVASDDTEEIVTVGGTIWRRVTSFSGQGAADEVYTFNYTTGVITFGNGVEGKIPVNLDAIVIIYTPNKNVYGKEIYENKWVSIKSNGIINNEVNIGATVPEEGIKITDSLVQVLHFPELTQVIGIWDNIDKIGTNYWTGGSFDADDGTIIPGTAFTLSTPYIEYKHQIKDDAEASYILIGDTIRKEFDNGIPKNNAKRLQLRIDVPEIADTEGGAFLKVVLRVFYKR